MTSKLFTEKYCPKSIKEFVGFSHNSILLYLKNVLNGTEKKKGYIMYGSAGTGKTTLALLLANHFDISSVYSNASDDRNKKAINTDVFRTTSLQSEKNLVIFDEVDGLSKGGFKELERIMKKYEQPIVLIANDITKIPYSIRKICHSENFSIDRFTLLALANRIVKAESLDLSRLQIKDIVDHSTSFRSLLHVLQFGMVGTIIPKQISTDTSVLNSLSGESVAIPTTELNDLIIRMNDNSTSPGLISLADLWNRRYTNGYTFGKNIVVAILSSIRNPGIKKLQYPRTYALIHEFRTGKKMKVETTGKKKSNEPRIRIVGFK